MFDGIKGAQMMRNRISQSSFFDSDYVCEQLVPKDSFYRKFRELVTPLIADEQFEEITYDIFRTFELKG